MNAITERIHLLESLSGNTSAVTAMLDKVITQLARQQQQKLSGIRQRLAELEGHYGMNGQLFRQRFECGELGDDPDWLEWDALIDMATELEQRLERIETVIIHAAAV